MYRKTTKCTIFKLMI